MYITELRGEKMFQNTPEDMLCDRGGEYRQYRNKYEEKERKNVMSLKNNKHFRRFAAALMAGTMMVSMFGMTAFAENPDNITSMDITKTVTAESNVLMPNTSFTFTVAPGSAGTTVDANNKPVSVTAGVTGGAYFGIADGNKVYSGNVTFAPDQADSSETVELLFDVSVFGNPGVYRYTITESDTTYDGVAKDTAVYTLDLWVTDPDEDGKNFIIQGAVAYKDGATSKAASITFNNQYTTNDLSLKKVIAGNQGNLGDTFTFKVTISGVDGEKYATDYPVDGGTAVLESGQEYEFTLGHNDTVHIYGLSATDTYTIVETQADGYTTTITGADTMTESTRTSSGNVATADDNVVYTNTKQVSTPTGVVLNIAPYIAMVALAGVLAFVFLRRRHNNF